MVELVKIFKFKNRPVRAFPRKHFPYLFTEFIPFFLLLYTKERNRLEDTKNVAKLTFLKSLSHFYIKLFENVSVRMHAFRHIHHYYLQNNILI